MSTTRKTSVGPSRSLPVMKRSIAIVNAPDHYSASPHAHPRRSYLLPTILLRYTRDHLRYQNRGSMAATWKLNSVSYHRFKNLRVKTQGDLRFPAVMAAAIMPYQNRISLRDNQTPPLRAASSQPHFLHHDQKTIRNGHIRTLLFSRWKSRSSEICMNVQKKCKKHSGEVTSLLGMKFLMNHGFA